MTIQSTKRTTKAMGRQAAATLFSLCCFIVSAQSSSAELPLRFEQQEQQQQNADLGELQLNLQGENILLPNQATDFLNTLANDNEYDSEDDDDSDDDDEEELRLAHEYNEFENDDDEDSDDDEDEVGDVDPWILRDPYQVYHESKGPNARKLTGEEHWNAMKEWLVEKHGGFAHEAIELRHYNDDPTLPFGLFLTQPVKAHEVLLDIPFETATIHSDYPEQVDSSAICQASRRLHTELLLGPSNSTFAPYVRYLLETQPPGIIPTLFSEQGRALLYHMVRGFQLHPNDISKQVYLPPSELIGWAYMDQCEPIGKHEYYAFQQVKQRSWDEMVIPLYDCFSHTNHPDLLNTDVDQVYGVDRIIVRASRDLQQNEELFCSYNHYPGDDELASYYGTPEIFRDFGFVEAYPQRWIFHHSSIAFDLDYFLGDEVNNPDKAKSFFDAQRKQQQKLQVQWLDDEPSEEDMDWAEDMLAWLEEYRATYLHPSSNLTAVVSMMPAHEVKLLTDYHVAITTALQTAIAAYYGEDLDEKTVMAVNNNGEEEDSDDDDDDDEEIERSTCVIAEGSCPDLTYDLLKDVAPGSLDYDHTYTCDAESTHSSPGYDLLESVMTHHHELLFDYNPDTDDMCFSIGSTLQQCSTYRPHYHEVAVHYAARYLKAPVKRVAWVGGGDSMLLHEILKYPQLELALGLELDQQVTRYNFKYFGTQPHWDDDDRVEWWYGDASKTLQMLPKDYYGSFDLVLVDLSDTVMDMSVTRHLDIFGAMALLLKKGGIMVKNEEYLEHLSRVFDYTVQVHFYDVPMICSQSFIFGSNDLDFFQMGSRNDDNTDIESSSSFYDHGVTDSNLLLDVRPDLQGRFDIWHDYRNNTKARSRMCQAEQGISEPVEQTESPGIMMAIEAEETTVDLKSINAVKDSIETALDGAGFQVIKSVVYSKAVHGGDMLAIFLQEGYVVMRTFVEYNYCAFDLHLWSNFGKQKDAKNALLMAVGSGKSKESSSSYRFVAGGMFGVSTWKYDESKRGPTTHASDCESVNQEDKTSIVEESAVTSVTHALLDQDIINSMTSIVFDEMIDEGNEVSVIVVCGLKSQRCASLEVLSTHEKVGGNIMPIWACPGVDTSMKRLRVCQDAIVDILQEEVISAGERFGAIVIDPDAPFAMGQMMTKIFSFEAHLMNLVTQPFFVSALSKDSNELWRRAFLDRIRANIIPMDPIFRAEVLFNTTTSSSSGNNSMELGIVGGGSWMFFADLEALCSAVKELHGLDSNIRNIQGGLFAYQGDDFKPAHSFTLGSYDYNSSLKQWSSQRPLALQTLTQIEIPELISVGETVMLYDNEHGYWVDGIVVWINQDYTFNIHFPGISVEYNIERKFIRKRFLPRLERIPAITLTSDQLQDVFNSSLRASGLEGAETVEFFEAGERVGEGQLFVAFWTGGSASLLWDGRNNVNINLFITNQAPVNTDGAYLLFSEIRSRIPQFMIVLDDEHPRGIGRVVNYQTEYEMEIAKGERPYWA